MAEAAVQAVIQGTDWVSALGGPTAVGGVLLYFLKRTMASVTESLNTVVASTADIKIRMAVHEAQSLQVQKSLETFRMIEKSVTMIEAQAKAAFGRIDDMKSRIDRMDSEMQGIREVLRALERSRNVG